MKTYLILVLLIIAVLFSVGSFSWAALAGWTYQSSVTIDNSTGAALTNQQVLVTLDTAALVTGGKMQADGDDIRFMDSDDTTPLFYWIESGMNSTSTRIWVNIPSIPATSTKTIYLYYGNATATAESSMEDTMELFEVGTVSTDHTWLAVNFSNTYDAEPVVIYYPASETDSDSGVPRIRNLDGSGFETRFHEEPGVDGVHATETWYWAVFNTGDYLFLDDTRIEVHRYTSSTFNVGQGSHSWETRTYNYAFADTPVVFSNIQTDNDDAFCYGTERNVGTSTVQLAIGLPSGAAAHANEDIGWLAAEATSGTNNGTLYEFTITPDNIRGHQNGWYTENFAQDYGESVTPAFIATMQKYDGSDGGWLRYRNLDNDSVQMHVDEDTVVDAEERHTTESAGMFVIGAIGTYPMRKYANPEPSASVTFPIEQLNFTTSAQTIFVDRVSSIMTIQAQDYAGGAQTVSSDTIIDLSSTSVGGEFSLTDSPFTAVTSVTISAGSSSASFYYRDSVTGTPIITGAENPSQAWTDASQQQTIEDVTLIGNYRRPITIDNTANATELVEYQILVEIDTQSLIASGKMQADGDDIRFRDSNDSTELYYWIESGINTANTKIWVRVPSIPASDTKTIYMYYGNDTASAASNLALTMDGESGSASIGSGWSSITLEGNYISPVIVTSHRCEGGQETDVRIQNVASNSFDMRLQNPGDKAFPNRDVFYFVIEEADLVFLDGTKIEGHTYVETHTMGSFSGDNSWNSISFDYSYSSAPVVLAQVMSYNDAQWVTDHVSNVNTNTARIAMEVGQLSYDHADETMGWIAMDNSKTGTISDIPYETGTTGDRIRGHDNGCYTTSFSQSFSQAPISLVDLRKRDGGDGGWVSICSLTATNLGTHVEEEDESDGERRHTTEDVSFAAFESAGALAIRKYQATEPTITVGAEDNVITQLAFTTEPQTIIQNQSSELMTVESQDGSGNTKTVTSNMEARFESTSLTGLFASEDDPDSWSEDPEGMFIPAGESSVSFYYKDTDVGTYTLTVSEYPSQGWEDATQEITVNSAVSTFSVSASSPQIAGNEFTLTITALDEDGNVSTEYSDPVNITVNYVSPATGTGVLSVTYAANFIQGVATITNETFSDCGIITISATKTDDAEKTGSSSNIVFVPSKITVEASELGGASPTGTGDIQTVNDAFTLTVSAYNASDAICPNYIGTTNLSIDYIDPSTSQSGTLSKTELENDDWNNGVSEITDLIYDKWGQITITATDATLTTQRGTSGEIFFIPKDFLITIPDPPPSRTYYYIGEPFLATVTARDVNDNSISNYQGSIALIGMNLEFPEETYTFVTDDAGSHQLAGINGTASGITAISVQDVTFTDIEGFSEDIIIQEGYLKVMPASGPVGRLSVQVKALDSNGAILIEDDSTTFTVTIDEYMKNNNSCKSDSTKTPVKLNAGAAVIVLEDDEQESVEVTPFSDPFLIPKPGIVQFGTVGSSGVGVQLYREIESDKYER